MRGRASGLGARISSMALLIGLAHGADHGFDEGLLFSSDAVFLVEFGIGPVMIPWLYRNPTVHASEYILRWLAKRYEKASEPRMQIRLDTLGPCKLNCVTAHASLPYTGGYHEQNNERARPGTA